MSKRYEHRKIFNVRFPSIKPKHERVNNQSKHLTDHNESTP